MSDDRIKDYARRFRIRSLARNYRHSRATYLEDQQRLVFALQDYGVISEGEFEPVGEMNAEIQQLIENALNEVGQINRDTSNSVED